MDEKDDTTPFAREPWQRLLEDGSAGPPVTTDARIRAAARRELAPHGRRWWLPASLAASFLLAVFIVQSQFGTLRAPVARESDRCAGGATTESTIDREQAQEARSPGQSPAADSAGAGPTVGGPERELKEAIEMPQVSVPTGAPQAMTDMPKPPPTATGNSEDRGNVAVTGDRRSEETPESGSRARSGAVAESAPATARIQPPPFEKTPEAWYAYVEKLRAEGKAMEADRQLARLEKAHPGWLELHLRERGDR